jgi:hypothetical protein
MANCCSGICLKKTVVEKTDAGTDCKQRWLPYRFPVDRCFEKKWANGRLGNKPIPLPGLDILRRSFRGDCWSHPVESQKMRHTNRQSTGVFPWPTRYALAWE